MAQTNQELTITDFLETANVAAFELRTKENKLFGLELRPNTQEAENLLRTNIGRVVASRKGDLVISTYMSRVGQLTYQALLSGRKEADLSEW